MCDLTNESFDAQFIFHQKEENYINDDFISDNRAYSQIATNYVNLPRFVGPASIRSNADKQRLTLIIYLT